MKVTLGQFTPLLGDKYKNLVMMENIMKEASTQGSDLVLFPELCLTGYFIQDLDENMAEPIDGPSITKMKELCQTFELYVVFSWPELSHDGDIYNSACLLSNQGEVIGNYRKIHLYDREKEVFKPGDSLDLFKTEFGNIGIMVCYDLDFPESARILNIKGADIILIPTNNFYPYERYQETYLRSRAMENEVPVIICNRTGQEQELKYFGESAAYDAHGHQLLKLDHLEQIKTVDMPLNKQVDENLSYKQNRMPNTYTPLNR